MARKFDLISKLYLDTSKEVLSPDKWAAFLRTKQQVNFCARDFFYSSDFGYLLVEQGITSR